ncbi:hypothetical protein [Halolamina salifodinae]|uniref:Choline-glycine betaine transporter n=1 Tax=Halolamina salifodinae TaxID=1202767 RepID=A0A8T4GU14_9EURY|nr:hypothetical protein [Halolamina salifodinae]MBP1985632.1 choline-glycine betaine transporter [Halolamina salifodinae]
MEYENLLRDWLLGLIAALLAAVALSATSGGDAYLDVLGPIVIVLAVVTFLAFVMLTGAFLVYTASFRD